MNVLGPSPLVSICGYILLCYFYRWFLSKGFGILLEVEIRDILEIQGMKSQDGESERAKGEVLEVRY